MMHFRASGQCSVDQRPAVNKSAIEEGHGGIEHAHEWREIGGGEQQRLRSGVDLLPDQLL